MRVEAHFGHKLENRKLTESVRRYDHCLEKTPINCVIKRVKQSVAFEIVEDNFGIQWSPLKVVTSGPRKLTTIYADDHCNRNRTTLRTKPPFDHYKRMTTISGDHC